MTVPSLPEKTYDLAVVGAGPLGTAAARHAARRGASVVLIGPEEPATRATHQGTWAGYYDQGRLCHVLEVPLVTSILTMRSRRRFADLIDATGITFLTQTASVTVLPCDSPGGSASDWFDADVLAANAADLGVPVDRLDPEALAAAYPGLTFEPGHQAVRERDAFILNPRALVAAATADAAAHGVSVVRDTVVARNRGPRSTELVGASGANWRANTVVMATGAATNATGLLDRPLVTPVFGASVVLAEVDGPDAVDMPTMMMLKQRGGQRAFGGIVTAPVQYPDGRWYLKVSGSSLLDNPLDGSEEIAAWVRSPGPQADEQEARELLAELLPGTEFLSFQVRPCLVCATPTDRPYIDLAVDAAGQQLPDTVVVVEGERGAMAGDEIGRLAANLALDGGWSDSVPWENFAAQWGEPGWTTRSYLAGAR